VVAQGKVLVGLVVQEAADQVLVKLDFLELMVLAAAVVAVDQADMADLVAQV
jgi:hypothetical protein